MNKSGRVLLAAIFLLAAQTTARARAAELEVLSLPEGSEERGRQTFQDLKCSVCHAVAGDETLRGSIAAKPGPVLGLKQSAYKSRFLAQSIVDPSHAIAPGFREKGGSGESRMGDFTETMTIRQLSDLVAYLKSRDEEV